MFYKFLIRLVNTTDGGRKGAFQADLEIIARHKSVGIDERGHLPGMNHRRSRDAVVGSCKATEIDEGLWKSTL